LEGCDAILNLAGENVAGIWTEGKRRAIRESRIEATRRIVEGMRRARKPPTVLVNGSATGIYGDTGEAAMDEAGPHGSGFLAEVCEAWEGEAVKARETGARVALLRTGIVLAREGGALAAMLPAFKLGLGGKLGDGRQWMSWIHLEDEAALALAAIEDARYEGAVNGTAPEAVRNGEFTKTLAKALRRPGVMWVPAIALKTALGGFSAEVLESRRVTPGVAGRLGFGFRFPTLEGALGDLVGGGEMNLAPAF
jgi:uncharacterized protein (TIGR01777 family)